MPTCKAELKMCENTIGSGIKYMYNIVVQKLNEYKLFRNGWGGVFGVDRNHPKYAGGVFGVDRNTQ
jgi:hypothetical protein